MISNRVLLLGSSPFHTLSAVGTIFRGYSHTTVKIHSGPGWTENTVKNSMAERYLETAIIQSNKELAALIQNLGNGCKKHLERCMEMAKKYNVINDQS